MEFTINKNYEKEIDVEKSRFIAYLFKIDSKDDFNKKLDEIKSDNIKARHHCFAYILDNDMRFSDDGEPKGTAGKPILNVLVNKHLNNCAIVVVRYFGGTLLGSGRLLRTYSMSATTVCMDAKLCEMVEEKEITVQVEIDSFDVFKNYLNKAHFSIKRTTFNDRIEIVFYTPLNFSENLESLFYKKVKVMDERVVKHEKEV